MTLKEKFDSISCKDCDMPYCDIKCTMLSDWELNKLEQIAEEFAIEFAKWFHKNYQNQGIQLYTRFGKWEKQTIEEILEIFKKEKGL